MEYQLTLILNILTISVIALGDIRMDSLKYKGCFDLSYSLSMNYHEHLPSISLEGCMTICSTKSSRYIGIELSDNFCYCGNDIIENSNSRDDSMCNVLCSDVSTRTCGGDWLMSVYDTQTAPPTPPLQGNNDSVLFMVGLSAGIRLYNESTLPNYETVMNTGNNGWAYTVDFHFARKLVYANTKGKLIMVNVSQTFGVLTSTPSVIRVLTPCDGFAVDWVLDKIYWADCTTRRPPIISMMDLDGNNNELLSQLGGNPRSIKRMEVDPYNRMLFWQADGIIESFNFSDKVAHVNVSKEGVVVRALALDRSVQRVYYVGSKDQVSALFSMDYRGNGQIKIFQVAQLQSVFGLGVHGDSVYWINYAMSTDIIYKAPLKIGGGQTTRMLQTVEKAVWHMRIVHADIQATPVENACSRKGCSHFCEAQSTSSGICHCPDSFQLSVDGRTCQFKNETVSSNETTSLASFTGTTTLATTTTDYPETTQFGDAKYLGCFGTTYAKGKRYDHRMIHVTFESCTKKCVELKMKYAGISARDKSCYCGPDLPYMSPKVMSVLCMDRCPDMVRGSCGGDWLMTVYDITKMLPRSNESDVDILEKDVSFLIGHSDSVKLYNISDLNKPQLLLDTENEWAYGVDYHYHRNLMFMSTRKALFRATLFPKNVPKTPETQIVKMSGCEAFAVDWVQDKIFWIDCPSTYFNVKVVDLDGNNQATILSREDETLIKRMVIDPYVGMLFWINDDNIESCETSGANSRTKISTSEYAVRGLTLDIPNQRLFYLGVADSGSVLLSADYEGKDLKTILMAPEMRGVYGIGVLKGHVYWINYVTSDLLYKAPIHQNSSGSSQIKLLNVFGSDSTVWHMKVVDPDLQKSPESGPCSSGSSSCLAQIVATKEEPLAGVVLLGVVAVLGVLLLAGLLMYLMDMKYWHIARTKLTRVPYTRERGSEQNRTTTYDINEDSVNLI